MRRRWLEIALVIVAAGLGTLTYREWRDSKPRFAFDATTLELHNIPVGQSTPLEYRVHNLTGNIMRVVGAEYT